MRKRFLLYLIFLQALLLQAQGGPGSIWYFGYQAGLDFSSGTAVALTNGQINTNEGCSVISDCNGNLLFYTDGQKVWDKNHNLMPNGKGLLGDWSSTQSSLVIPVPGSSTLYYLFTTTDYFNAIGNGLRYSIVDMSLNGGLGDINATKNILLMDPTSEKMTAARHANGTDFWLIAHSPQGNTNEFRSFLISSTGITPGPVSNIPPNIANAVSRIGYLKLSPDGKRLAQAFGGTAGRLELYDFDNSTGIVSNQMTLNDATGKGFEAYGVEFSPNGNLLYASYSTDMQIYQFDLTLGTQAAIFASRDTIVFPKPSVNGSTRQVGALQLAPDGKIYVSTTGNDYVSRINNPNVKGMGCNFVEQGVFLGGPGHLTNLGLPNFASGIDDPASPLTLSSSNIQNASCNAASDGSATVNAVGGSGVYSYSWNNGDTTATASGLQAGDYTVIVTSAVGGCSPTTQADTLVVTITEPAPLTASANNIVDESCNQANGSATVVPVGGNGTFTYSWNNGITNAQATNLSMGTYTILVTDVKGCTTTTTATIGQAPALIVDNISITAASCNATDGAAAVTVSGGGGSYTYSWSNGATTNALSNVAGGTYSVTVTDVNNCTLDTQVVINTANGPQVSVLTSDSATCFGSADGVIEVAGSGGQGNITYSWSNGNTAASASNLVAGSYTITVSDANSCSVVQVVSISEPTALNVSNLVVVDASCGAADGSAFINPSGGTGAYTYSWSNASTTNSIGNLTSGVYDVLVTDAYGCTQTTQASIGNANGPQISTQQLSNIQCNGSADGSIQVTVSGGQPTYTYSWSNGATTQNISSLTSGTYSVIITDGNNCSYTQQFDITEPTALTANATSLAVCGTNNGSATITVSGGSPVYSYSWSNGASANTISGLASGSYTCVVTDANGCTHTQTVNVIVNPLPTVSVSNDTTVFSGEEAQLNAAGAPSFVWTPNTNLSCTSCQSPIATPTVSTTYYVYVTDANGCSSMDSVFVEVMPLPCELDKLFIPTAFTPGVLDGMNDVLYVRGIRGYLNYEFMIFNRWGEKVFYSTNPDEGWDGTFRGKSLDAGVFVYYLTIACSDNNFITKQGNITLVK